VRKSRFVAKSPQYRGDCGKAYLGLQGVAKLLFLKLGLDLVGYRRGVRKAKGSQIPVLSMIVSFGLKPAFEVILIHSCIVF